MPGKWGKLCQAMIWVITCSKRKFGERSFLEMEIFSRKIYGLLTKEARCYKYMTQRPYNCFCRSSALPTRRGSLFAESVFKHYPYVILHDDMLERFLGNGYSGANYGVGDGLGKFSLQHDVGLAGFLCKSYTTEGTRR